MKHTILIVDDTPENLDVLKGVLTPTYDVKVAINGSIALKIAEKFRPNLILLDIMMPEMDGYEVSMRLKENPLTSHIPIIFITAMNDALDEAKGFDSGAVDYITKPISPVVVMARVKTHLALSDQQIALDFEVKKKTKELSDSRIDLVERLARASEYNDNDTGNHLEKVQGYMVVIAKECELSSDEQEIIALASKMHDVGKIGIKDEILMKPGKYTEEEFNIMKTHCALGAEILGSHTDKLLSAASIVALQHHERWDGTGYPNGLEGDEIHLYARICAIADVFDALTSKRSYKKAWDFEEAWTYLFSQSGTHFDPYLIEQIKNAKQDFKTIYEQYNNISV